MTNSYLLLILPKAGAHIRVNSPMKPSRLSCRIVPLSWFFLFVHFLKNFQPISLENKRADKFLTQILRGADCCVTTWCKAGHQTILQVPKTCFIFKVTDGAHVGAKCLREISIMLALIFFAYKTHIFIFHSVTNPWPFQVPRHQVERVRECAYVT